jgi:hypothetical protein
MSSDIPMPQTESSAVARHRTALKRVEASRPIQLAMRDSVVTPTTTVLDYGCGQDVRLLRAQGIGYQTVEPCGRSHAPGEGTKVILIFLKLQPS